MTKKKLTIGFYGVTGCAGCLLSFLFNEDEILNIIKLVNLNAFPFVKEVSIDKKFDYCFIEGLVASKDDIKQIKKLRKNSKNIVALGSCADTGCIPAYRTYSLKENYEHLLYKKDHDIADVKPTPISEYIKIDFTIPGCPPNKSEIINFIKDIVKDKVPKHNENPVCFECKLNENHCLLEQNKPCLGPITKGGCDSVCINGGFECWGCRGPTHDMNLILMVQILKQMGYDDQFIENRLRTFVGLKLPMLKRIFNDKDN
jgi:sulfhydrogenase subunit delta